MIGSYKFLNSRDVNHVLSGSIQISSLAYYRYLEGKNGFAGVGDKDEGLKRTIGSLQIPLGTGFKSGGINIGRHSSATLGSNTFVAPHCLVMCFTNGQYDLAKKAMCDDTPDSLQYDACIQINDVEELARRIWNDGTLKDSGERVCERFHHIELGKIEYQNIEVPWEPGSVPKPSPFEKGLIFRDQQEARLVFYENRKKGGIHRFRIQVPIPDSLLEQVDDASLRPRSLVAPVDQCSPSLSDRMLRLADCIDADLQLPRRGRNEVEFDRHHKAALDLLWEARLGGFRFQVSSYGWLDFGLGSQSQLVRALRDMADELLGKEPRSYFFR